MPTMQYGGFQEKIKLCSEFIFLMARLGKAELALDS